MKYKSIGLLLICCSLLSSCSEPISFREYKNDIVDKDTYQRIEEDNYYKPEALGGVSYTVDDTSKTIDSYKDLYEYRSTRYLLNSVGEQNILVVPTCFSDDNLDTLPNGRDNTLRDLKVAFFGDEKFNQYESVASFYNKSSYGKLRIGGEVTSWCALENPSSYYLGLANKEDAVKKIYDYVISWCGSQEIDLDKYYIDNDSSKGVAIFIVYAHEFVESSSKDNLFWAYALINPNPICFASVHFMYLEGKKKIDARTYIHELGHAFGLDDYYDKDNGNTSYLGKVDMMDSSLGDHNPYSKMTLNWARPYVVTSKGEITIKPFTNSGEFILVNNSWNGSCMDEYLLIEYFVPGGLNHRFASSILDKPCIRIYHVDSRVGYFTKTLTYSFAGYINVASAPSNYYLRIGNENLSTSKNKLVKLLPSDSSLVDTVNRSDVYFEGDSFGYDSYQSFRFNNGSELSYKFKITNINNVNATILFE